MASSFCKGEEQDQPWQGFRGMDDSWEVVAGGVLYTSDKELFVCFY